MNRNRANSSVSKGFPGYFHETSGWKMILLFFCLLFFFSPMFSPSILGRDKSPDSYAKDARLDSVFRNIWLRKTAKHDRYSARRSELTLSKDFSKVPGKQAFDFFEPEWNCEDEVRFGSDLVNNGDGPKFTCGVELLNSLDECIVYSIGSNYDFSFEYAVHNAAPHCVIHTFDGTLNLTKRALPDDLADKNIHFHNQNVVAEDCHAQSSFPSLCVADLLKKLNHEYKTITWLKVDCEGCEFTVMPIFMKYEVKVDQIMIEVHGTDAVQIAELFQVLHDAGLMIFHKERNHWGCDGYRCVEYSLISAEYGKRVVQNYLSASKSLGSFTENIPGLSRG